MFTFTQTLCIKCNANKQIIGYDKGDPKLECGHVSRILSDRELTDFIEKETKKALDIIMKEQNVSHDEAQAIYINDFMLQQISYSQPSNRPKKANKKVWVKPTTPRWVKRGHLECSEHLLDDLGLN